MMFVDLEKIPLFSIYLDKPNKYLHHFFLLRIKKFNNLKAIETEKIYSQAILSFLIHNFYIWKHLFNILNTNIVF